MTVLFGCVLLCSFVLEKLASPAGDAVLRAVDSKNVSLTGVIEPQPGADSVIFRDAQGAYDLSDPAKARPHAGRRVHIAGILHEASHRLDVREIRDAGNY